MSHFITWTPWVNEVENPRSNLALVQDRQDKRQHTDYSIINDGNSSSSIRGNFINVFEVYLRIFNNPKLDINDV